MSFVAKLISFLLIAMSFSIAPSNAAQSETTLTSQTPLWVERNQSVEFVLEADDVAQTIDVYISSNPLVGRSSLNSYQNDTLSIEFRKLANITTSQTSNQVTISIASLSLETSGVYVIEFRNGNELLTSTLLSYIGNKNIKPLNTVLLWPITAPPTLSPTDESLIEDYWTQNIGLIEAVRAHPLNSSLSWIMDADVFTSANNTANEEWLSNVRSATQDADVYVGAYANSDVNALIKARRMQLAKAAMSSILPVSQALNRSNIPRAILSDGFSPRSWNWIDNQGIYLSITSNQQFPSSTSIFTPSAIVENPFGKKSLVADKRVSRLMNRALQNSNPQSIQLLQAELFITALEQPQLNRTMVIYPTLWNMSSGAKTRILEIFTSKWLNPIGASEALRKPITTEREIRSVQTSTLSDRQRSLINDLESYRKRLAPFIADSIHNIQTIHAGLRVASVFDKNRQTLMDATEIFFDDLLGAVSIVSSGSVVFARESGVIPITIRNNLSVPVYVNVFAQGFPEVRVELGNIDFVEIGAGQRKSIEIPATLYGSESAFVDLQLVDALGKKIGELKRIEIASSAYASIAGIFVSAAFGLLFLLLIYNTQKRIRASRAAGLENSARE